MKADKEPRGREPRRKTMGKRLMVGEVDGVGLTCPALLRTVHFLRIREAPRRKTM